jgi:hypothetical protein
MKKIILSLTLLFAIQALAQYSIIVDGNSADWDNNDGNYNGSQLSDHGSGYFNGQWIYKGVTGDQRTDIANYNDDNDITEVRFGTDGTSMYFLIRMQAIDDGGEYTYVSLSIDTDQNNSDLNLNWNGDDTKTTLGSRVQYGERNLTIYDVTPGAGINIQLEMFKDIFFPVQHWLSAPAGTQVNISAQNDIVEGKIYLSELGITANSTIRVSLATYVNANNGLNENVDATQNIAGTSDGIDVMTPGAVSGNAWARDLSDGDIDYSALINLSIIPLPVELTSFSALVIGKDVKLSWNTATEINNYGFEIERMSIVKGQTSDEWQKIGFVNGNGNSNSPKSYSFMDDKVTTGKYSYRLKQIDNDGQYEYSKTIEVDLNGVKEFELSQNYPNPFNPSTTIRFNLREAENVKLTLYNILGQEIKSLLNEFKEAGVHSVNFNASELNSGIYIYKIESGLFIQTRKMTLVK